MEAGDYGLSLYGILGLYFRIQGVSMNCFFLPRFYTFLELSGRPVIVACPSLTTVVAFGFLVKNPYLLLGSFFCSSSGSYVNFGKIVRFEALFCMTGFSGVSITTETGKW